MRLNKHPIKDRLLLIVAAIIVFICGISLQIVMGKYNVPRQWNLFIGGVLVYLLCIFLYMDLIKYRKSKSRIHSKFKYYLSVSVICLTPITILGVIFYCYPTYMPSKLPFYGVFAIAASLFYSYTVNKLLYRDEV